MRGFAAIPLIIILVVAGVVGVGWYSLATKHNTPVTSSPSPVPTIFPTPTPIVTSSPSLSPKVATPVPKTSTTPLVDCVGPDGKHLSLSQTDCSNFLKAWATPTPTPTPVQTSSNSSPCNTSTDLGNLIVNVQPQSGQSLIGDTSVEVSNGTGDCAGHDSRLPDYVIIKQGSTSGTYPSLRPGKYHVQVTYHGNSFFDGDVSINPGDNPITVTVSN